jgi:hypothetical protein
MQTKTGQVVNLGKKKLLESRPKTNEYDLVYLSIIGIAKAGDRS